MSAETHGHTERGAVERAAEVLGVVLNEAKEQSEDFDSFDTIAFWLENYRQALAAAGLLLSDADRAVLDAADEWVRLDPFAQSFTLARPVIAAVRARRETQP